MKKFWILCGTYIWKLTHPGTDSKSNNNVEKSFEIKFKHSRTSQLKFKIKVNCFEVTFLIN